MLSFYKRYPPIEDTLLDRSIKILFPIIPSGLVINNALKKYSSLGANNEVLFLFGASVFLFFAGLFIGKFVVRRFQKMRYLIRYGTKKDVVCTKVKRVSAEDVSHPAFNFYYSDLDGSSHGLYVVATTVVTKGIEKIKEGDILPIIYNPDNPKNSCIDSDKFNIR